MHTFTKYSVKLVRESNVRYDAPNRAMSAKDVYDICTTVLSMHEEPSEVLVAIYLDCKNKVIGLCEVSRGTINASLMEPREVLKGAILANAYGIVLVHNHPSGDTQPSSADKEVTNRLSAACNLMRITLLDHVVIGHDDYFSLRDNSMM